MLPSLRTMIAAIIATAIFVSLIGIALIPAPGGNYMHSAGFPPAVQPASEHNPNRQSFHMLGDARRVEELNGLLAFSPSPPSMTVELSSAASDTFEGATSPQPVAVSPRLKPTPARVRVRRRIRLSRGTMAGTYTRSTMPPSRSDPNTTSFNGTHRTVSTSERTLATAPATSAATRDSGF